MKSTRLWLVSAVMMTRVAYADSTGELVFVTTPTGAEVFVDGKAVGRTPTQAQLLPGEHVVQVKWGDGQQTSETIVSVEGGKSSLVSFKVGGAAGGPVIATQTTGPAPQSVAGTATPVVAAPPAAPVVMGATAAPVTVAATTAAADPATKVEAKASEEDEASSKLWLGGQVELMPTGSLAENDGSGETSFDTAAAYGVRAILAYQVTPLIRIALAPRYVLNVKPSLGGDASSLLDISARVSAGKEVIPKLRVEGFGGAGYGMLFLPSSFGGGTAGGLTITLGGGVRYALNPRTAVIGEIGYELGFEGISKDGGTETIHVNYLHLGGGVAIALGH